MRRLAFIVSHPIQYYAPLHQRLAHRGDLRIKVFFTWHDGRQAVRDSGFQRVVAWDIPLTEGYEWELVPNVAAAPGTHHFLGLRNPTLVKRVLAWQPDAVHVTGWAWASHLWALRSLRRRGVPTLFRGDSHLLDETMRGPRWRLKEAVLRQVFAWPSAVLYVGQANRAYYEAFGVTPDRLYHCPHSIDVARFAEPAELYQREARVWRQQLGIADDDFVLLFAGKLERKKRPIELMRVVLEHGGLVLILVGNGELEGEVQALAAAHPTRFRVLPFQNQSRMPVVYRLGDIFVLPSGWGETWGLAVNEALACGRPVLVSDRVGCAGEVLEGGDPGVGAVFPSTELSAIGQAIAGLAALLRGRQRPSAAAIARAWAFDISRTEASLASVLEVLPRR
jgi:glycosyltransferase involved in cell wall biosynthesis